MNRPAMQTHVTVLDYGLGNHFSIQRALSYVGAKVEITSRPQDVLCAQSLILPGVGAFGDGIRQLRERNLINPIQRVAEWGRPLLGICLGMQLLFSQSEEFGIHEGLNLIGGDVVRLHDSDLEGRRVKVPHIGWSELRQPDFIDSWESSILSGLSEGDAVYFVHSYVPRPENHKILVANTLYGNRYYCAVVEERNIVGCQFHPEKSGEVGLQVLRNFLSRR